MHILRVLPLAIRLIVLAVLGIVLAGLLFGGLHTGGLAMQSMAGTPLTLSMVLQALIVLFVAAPGLVHTEMPFLRARRAPIAAGGEA